MLNKVMLIGNLGQDPEVRQTAGGQSVANLSVATSERWTDKSGQKQERTEWHRIVVWDKLADLCAQYLHKGKKVYVEGQLQTREWEDRDGNKRWTTEIRAREVKFLSPREDSSSAPPSAPTRATDSGRDGFDDGDIPF